MAEIFLHPYPSEPPMSGLAFRGKELGQITGDKIGDYTVQSSKSLTHGIAAVTNEVFDVTVATGNSEAEVAAIIKIGKPGTEHRERTVIFQEGSLGGWLNGRLQNEALLTTAIQSNGVPSPQILHFEKLADGMEVLVEEKVSGQTCLELREVTMPPSEREQLEKAKGTLLAKINTTPVSTSLFGPLTEGSMRFETWPEYFNYKLSTTLSLLYGMYDDVSSLQHFSKIASSEKEWQEKVGHIVKLYSSSSVQALLQADGFPTLTHGDFWDANIISQKDEHGTWKTTAIDLERGDISGKSFDLALWLEWKIGGDTTNPHPLDASASFLEGYKESGGIISPDIKALTTVYALWQYLDFLVLDKLYALDRTDESAYEINKLIEQLEGFVKNSETPLSIETVTVDNFNFYKKWLEEKGVANTVETKKTVTEVFGKQTRIVINGLRLPPAPQFDGHLGLEATEKLLQENIEALKAAGVDGVVLETTFDRPHKVFYQESELLDYYLKLVQVAKQTAGKDVKVGINLILFDLPGSLAIAKAAGLDFVVTDEFVEPIICPADESYQGNDFHFIPQPEAIQEFREEIGAQRVMLFAGTHSNYYDAQSNNSPIDSIKEAKKYGAEAVVIGKKNGTKLDSSIYQTDIPIFIAGGVTQDDLPWIKNTGFNGFLAGSLFEGNLTNPYLDPRP